MKKLIFALAFLLLAIPCQARTITVDDDGPADFNTIQAAINDSNDGDTIIVADGTYTGDGNRDIDFFGKAITLRSENGSQNCIIDCNGTEDDPHRGFKFVSGEGPDSVVTGFTIASGHGPLDYIKEQYTSSIGGAILCSTSNPTISNCNIRGNSASNGGAICCCKGSAPKIENCAIVNNSGFGGGIYCIFSSPEIINCVISDNIAPLDCSFGFPICLAVSGGGIACEKSGPTISNCLISGNSATANGGGIYSYKGNPIINNCTISCNSADSEGGGIRCYSECVMTVSNCILWSNTASGGQQISLKKMSDLCPTITISYSDIQSGQAQLATGGCAVGVNWGEGNIDTDPCFADPCNGDYHLKSQAGRWEPNSQSWVVDGVTSPCIDAGNPGCPVGDEPAPNGNRRNMGAYGGTAEASKSPADWRNIADMTNDWIVDSNDLKVFVDYWLNTGGCIPSDLNRSQFVDFDDFAMFGQQWSYPSSSEPGITYQIEKCDPSSYRSLATEQATETRFSVLVEGSYIHFKDMMVANCCTEELGLEMTVEEDLITIYEIEYVPGPCFCICDYPVTATLGPFQPGTYILEVYEEWSGFIGSTTVVIGPPG